MTRKQPDIADQLDRIFKETMADTVVLTADKATGKVNCAVFSEQFNEAPLRYSTTGAASAVMRNMLTSILKGPIGQRADAEKAKAKVADRERPEDDDII